MNILYRLTFIVVTLLSGVCLYNSLKNGNTIAHYYELKESEKLLEETIKTLESDVVDLETKLTRIKNSPEYAKKFLKDKYNITEKGETFVYYKD